MGRKAFPNSVIRDELCGQLRTYFKTHKSLNRKALAEELGISRAALYKHIGGYSTPSPELLAKFLELPDMSLTIAGRRITSAELATAAKPEKIESVQYELPFDVPVYVEGEATRLTLGIIRKNPGTAQSLEFTVQINLPASGAKKK